MVLPSSYTELIAQRPSSINGTCPVKLTTKQISRDICCTWSVGKFYFQYCQVWTELPATFQSPVPSLSSAYSCIVFLHQARPQKPSLTLRGLEFASFTDIRVCLCGWVMDLLCWYVLLWWLQRPLQWLGSLHKTVTQRLLCFSKTFRRWLFTQQTVPSPNNTPKPRPPTVNAPVPLTPLASLHSQTKSPGT